MIILGLYRPPIVSDIATKYDFVIFTAQRNAGSLARNRRYMLCPSGRSCLPQVEVLSKQLNKSN